MSGLGDYQTAAEVRDIVAEIAKRVIQEERPLYRYGTVISVNTVDKKALVQYTGDDGSIWLPYGALRPASGEKVRVGGIEGDRHIVDVFTDEYPRESDVGGVQPGYTHPQSVAAATWTVEHNLGFKPNVTVFDTEGRIMRTGVEHIDSNTLEVTIVVKSVPVALTGTAVCS